jgi:hypothetical protein
MSESIYWILEMQVKDIEAFKALAHWSQVRRIAKESKKSTNH